MRQLVGCLCSLCNKTIESIVEGVFCDDCGNPVHKDCIASDAAGADKCQTCGADIANPVAKQVRWERQVQKNDPYTAARLISERCPSCGGAEYTTVRPTQLIAFARDRICSECGTRYTPITPIWGSLALIGVGLILQAMGLLGIMLGLAGGRLSGACELFLIVLGFFAVLQGGKGLISSRRV
jgi:hypothetical protein